MFADPEVRARLDGLSMFVVGGTAAAARDRGLADSKTWGDLIRALLLHRLGSPRSRGQVLPIFALMFVFLFGIVALALDAGHLFLVNLQVQNAVDSATLAAGKHWAVRRFAHLC